MAPELVYRSFVKIEKKNSRNVEISLSLNDVVYSCPSREFETWHIRENKVLAKFSEFTELFRAKFYYDFKCYISYKTMRFFWCQVYVRPS